MAALVMEDCLGSLFLWRKTCSNSCNAGPTVCLLVCLLSVWNKLGLKKQLRLQIYFPADQKATRLVQTLEQERCSSIRPPHSFTTGPQASTFGGFVWNIQLKIAERENKNEVAESALAMRACTLGEITFTLTVLSRGEVRFSSSYRKD